MTHEDQNLSQNQLWWQATLRRNGVSALLSLLTIYALFGDDIRLAWFEKDTDDIFYAISSVALGAFFFELLAQWYCKPEYRGGFYFVLDFVSTLSLIPDIGWLWQPLTGTGDDDASDTSTALKAGRASRVGTRTGRIVRIVRLVRMVRIVRLWKIKQEREVDDDVAETLEEQIQQEPSKVGKRLTELTTRRVIVLVLVMILVLPVFDGDVYSDENSEEETFRTYGFLNLHRMPQDFNATGGVSEAVFRAHVETFAREAGAMLYLSVYGWPEATTQGWLDALRFQPVDGGDLTIFTDGFTRAEHPVIEWKPSRDMMSVAALTAKYRPDERALVQAVGCYDAEGRVTSDDCISEVYFDATSDTTKNAWMNIIKTFVTMVVLTCAVVAFSRDAQYLVIDPIERMMRLVRRLSENPLGSTKRRAPVDAAEAAETQGFETVMLEQTLSKISSLLQVGFGVAGAEIIGRNMSEGESLDAMIAGKKITAVFGFGIIEDFTETCTALEDQVCMYINSIAKIVHGGTHQFHGAANKNIGSAFLLVWKICDGSLPGLRDLRDPPPDPNAPAPAVPDRAGIATSSQGGGRRARNVPPQEMVDSALAAFIKVRVDLHLANAPGGTFEPFLTNPAVVAEFGEGFKVHMGFGLHIGWAIEGAIGSRFKIDASYLSPNVNMAARLEAATHQFGCPMLMSGFFVEELSPAARKLCRMIDRVTVKGSQVPLDLWTFDIDPFVDAAYEPRLNSSGEQVPVDFARDELYVGMQANMQAEFFELFEAGVQAYLDGEWQEAKELLEDAQQLRPDDGPTRSLLRVMGFAGFQAPGMWRGVRELTSK